MKPTEIKGMQRAARFYQFGPFLIDTAKRTLACEGKSLPLTPKAFDTLVILVERSGELVTKDELMSTLWPDTFVEEGSLTRNISALRKALGENPREHRYIVTIPGQGYRFVAHVTRLAGETGNLRVMERTRTSIIITEQSPDESDESNEGEVIEAETVSAANGLQPAEHRLQEPANAGPSQSGRVGRHKMNSIVAIVSVVVVAMAATAFVVYKIISSARRQNSQETKPVATAPQIEITRLTTTGNIGNGRPAVSPDGKFMVYAVFDSPRSSSLWLRQIATHTSEQLVPSAEVVYEGATFSPDGNHIYYCARERNTSIQSLHKIPIVKGPPRRVLDDIDGPVSFAPDGSRFVFHRNHPARRERSLVVANADGSNQQEVAVIKYPEFFGDPAWSPDGKLIATAAGHADGGANRYLVQVSVGDWTMKEISKQRWRWVGPVEWLSDGNSLLMIASDNAASIYQIWHLDYLSGEARKVTNDTLTYSRLGLAANSSALVATQLRLVANLWTVPVDDVGKARRITFGTGGFRARLGWTRDRKIVVESMLTGSYDISILNDDGSQQRHLLGDLAGRAAAGSPAVTPDGRYVLFFYDLNNLRHIWRINIDGSNPIQLTNGGGEDLPQCTPDGRWVIYTDIGSNDPNLWRVAIDGGEPVQLTNESAKLAAISPDGKLIACIYSGKQTDLESRLAILPIDGGEPVKIFPQSASRVVAIKWTPDGRGLAYVDNIKDQSNIWVQAVEGGEPKQLTRFDSDQIFGFEWSPDGKSLACTRGIWERNLVLIKNFR